MATKRFPNPIGRALILVVVLVLALTAYCPAQSRHAPPRKRSVPTDLPEDEARIVQLQRQVMPSVVTILTRRSTPGGPTQKSLGTGILITADNHILTAAHVVDGADVIRVKTQDGRLRRATILFSEPDADVALIRLAMPDATLPHAQLGNSDRLAAGQRLLIIGNPRGLENSLSVGHISAFRNFGELYDGSIRLEFIQTDAAINSGNSGGPAFDSKGRVVGIASRILTHSGGSEGLGFVVAINTAKQLLALEHRAWTGLRGVFLSHAQLAALSNLEEPGGLLIQSIAKGSPAAKAGLRGGTVAAVIDSKRILLGGDLILRLGDQDACHAECLIAAHARFLRAKLLSVVFLRGGKRMRTTLDLSTTQRSFLRVPKKH